MTKRIKTSLTTVLVCILAFACCFTVAKATARIAAAAEVDTAKIEAFTTAVEALDADDFDPNNENYVGNKVYDAKVRDARNLYVDLSDQEKAAVAADVMSDYNKVWNAYKDADDVRNYIADLFKKEIRYSMKDEIADLRASYDALTDNAKQYVKNLTEIELLTNAEAKIAEIEVNIKAAIDAINKIELRHAETEDDETVTYTMVADHDENNEVVLGSKETIVAATTALDAIYGKSFAAIKAAGENIDYGAFALTDEEDATEYDFKTVYTVYEGYLDKLTAIEKVVSDLADEVNAVYDKINENLFWSIYEDEIKPIIDGYEALDETEFNDMKAAFAAIGAEIVEDENNEDESEEGETEEPVEEPVVVKTVKDKYDAIVARVAATEKAIADVNAAIEAIGAIDYDKLYTYDTDAEKYVEAAEGAEDALDGYAVIEKLITDARTAFEALDADIVAHDKADEAPETYFVEKYPDLVAAEADHAKLDADVNALVAKIAALVGAEELEEACADARKDYNDLKYDLQRSKVKKLSSYTDAEGNEFDVYDEDGETVITAYDLLLTMEKKVAEIKVKVAPVIKAIDAIPAAEGDFVSNDEFINALVKAEELYKALEVMGEDGTVDADASEQVQRFVTNRQDMFAKRAIYDGSTQDIKAWTEAVKPLYTVNTEDGNVAYELIDITVTNMELVSAAVTAYEAMSDTSKTAVGTATGYSKVKKIYDDAIAARTALLDSIEAAADMMDEIPTDLDNIPLENATEFSAKFDAADEAYKALAEDAQEYLQAEYADAYAKYLAAKEIGAVLSVEAKILAIPAIEDMKVTDVTAIETAREAFDALSEENQEQVRNLETLEAAEAAIAEMLKKYDEWIAKVEALLGDGEYEDAAAKLAAAAELHSVDLDVVQALEEEYASFFAKADEGEEEPIEGDDETEEGEDEGDEPVVEEPVVEEDPVEKFITEYLSDAKELLAKIKEVANQRITDLNDKIAELPDTLEKDHISTLKEIEAEYNKLHKTQRDKVNYKDFKASYDKLVYAGVFEEAVMSLKTNYIDAGNFTVVIPVMTGMLRSIYTNCSDEQKALINPEAIKTLDEIDAAYAAALEDEETEILSLKKVNDALNEALKKMGEAFDPTELMESVEALKTGLEKVEQDLLAKEDALKQAIEDVKTAYAEADKALEAKDTELKAEIDAAVAALEAAKTGLEDKDAELEVAIAALETAKTALEAKDTELKAEIDAAVAALEAAKTALEAKDAELAAKVADLETKIAAANAAYADADKALETKITNAYTAAIKAAADKADGKMDEFTKELTTLAAKLTDLENKLTKLDTDMKALIAKTNADLSKADADIAANVDAQVDALKALIEAAKKEVTDAYKAEMSGVTSGVTSVEDAYKAADAKISARIDQLDNFIKAELDRLDKADAQLQENIDAMKAQLQKSIRTVTIIFAILMACMVAAIVIIYVKKMI